MIKLLEKTNQGKYFYKGQKAEYTAECDEIGNCYLTINKHAIIKDGATSLHEWLEGAEITINRIESGKKVLL